MPKQTFFNISSEKKDRLLSAARKEFSKYSFNKASINRIIKEAKIPRGSFYQYFEDKQDLYLYCASGIENKLKAMFLQNLKAHHGDLFATIKGNIKNATRVDALSKEYKGFLRVAVENRDYRLLLHEIHRNKKHFSNHQENFLEQLYQQTDLTLLKVNDYEGFRALSFLIVTCFVHSLESIYAITDKETKIDGNLVTKKFYWMIDMIEYGAKNNAKTEENRCSN